MSINYYVDAVEERCLSGALVLPFKKDMLTDVGSLRFMAFLTSNMQVIVRRLGSSHLMSVVRSDGRRIEKSDILYDLKSQIFPSSYDIVDFIDCLDNFEVLYPLCVIFGRVYRQSAVQYHEECITRCLIKRIG